MKKKKKKKNTLVLQKYQNIQNNMKENRLTPSRFRKLSKSKTAAHENSSILTRAVTGRRGGFTPSGVSFCFGLAVISRRIK